MLSHLRFHRRGPSNPASPLPDQNPTSPHSSLLSPYSPETFSPDQPTPSSASPALPPTLPPITRVTSAEAGPSLVPRRDADMAPESDPRLLQQSRSPYNAGSGFIGGVALQKYQRDIEGHNADPMDNARSPVPQSGPSRRLSQTTRNSMQPAASFSTPTDLQNSAGAPTARRPAGARVQVDLPMLSQTPSNAENPKPKKGLPFLKNPMSTLLMRRKNSQQMASLTSLPLRGGPEEPMYDPRIKGTRVHDFSAPRPRKVAPVKDSIQAPSPSNSTILPEKAAISSPPLLSPESAQLSATNQHAPSNASESIYSQDSGALKNTPSTISTISDPTTGGPDAAVLPPPPQHAPPPLPPPPSTSTSTSTSNEPISVQPRSSQASRLIDETSSIYSRASTRLAPSRGPSVSGFSIKDLSSLPRHMKSTSSRFSFDMIGAAKQEKLLEERHRQREAEKRISEPPSASRDSRYDDFDEDGFDYDAMMDDDGLEERIPGVNADYEDGYYEEEINMVGDDDVADDDTGLDPDNDQENFAGFVFQRSNPTSSLTSPQSTGFLMTPRDVDGNPIGHAMSRYSPRLPDSVSPSLLSPHLPTKVDQPAGLGIQGLDVPGPTQHQNNTAFQQNQQLNPANPPRPNRQDDLYFDGGMTGFENEFAEDLAAPPEWDDTPFDESIFDNNDTDQYGRPIAGVFAQAQAERRAALEDVSKRESDLTCRLSAGSGVSQSTAHTSPSASGARAAPDEERKENSPPHSPEESPVATKETGAGGDSIAAYQAALAAAAHKAVLSGKLNRESSHPPNETSTSEMGYSSTTPDRGGTFDEDCGYSYEDMADFELDDDAIIAEANASALANDSDGWYGQEFGFYSALAPSHHGSQNATEIDYANGGVFAPRGGLDRSMSGRMVSREPNLTPITERSEYSNRNSIMSLNMPGFSSGTPIQSPGLAQLALMGDRGDEMSLSALLRLRSKAWGGSQASLVSSQGSPRSERGDVPGSPWAPTFSSPTTYQARKNSVLSTVSQDSEDNYSVSGSPTLTSGIPGLTCPPPPVPLLGECGDESSESTGVLSSPVVQSPQQWDMMYSPVANIPDTPLSPTGMSTLERHRSSDSTGSNGARRAGLGHRHKGSAESISYMKEEDSGTTRWVLERRRTGESGQEILEREVVENGRI